MNLKSLEFAAIVFTAMHVGACGGSESSGSDASGGTKASTDKTPTSGEAGLSSQAGATGSGTATPPATSTGTGGSTGGACKSEKDTKASASAAEACKAFCVAEDGCDTSTTIENCESYRACAEQDTGPAGCGPASKIYWDCLRAQTDLCTAPEECCQKQADAVSTACKMP